MGKFQEKIFDKYFETGEQKYLNILSLYWKVREFPMLLPKAIASTYLCWRFPFLKYKKGLFHKSCKYWQIEKGWRKAFGIQMCKELKKVLKRHKFLYKWEITTIKDKFGALDISDTGAPSEVHDILDKYNYISSRTCHKCGRRAMYRTRGWEEPYCEDCIENETLFMKPGKYYEDFDWYGWKK